MLVSGENVDTEDRVEPAEGLGRNQTCCGSMPDVPWTGMGSQPVSTWPSPNPVGTVSPRGGPLPFAKGTQYKISSSLFFTMDLTSR